MTRRTARTKASTRTRIRSLAMISAARARSKLGSAEGASILLQQPRLAQPVFNVLGLGVAPEEPNLRDGEVRPQAARFGCCRRCLVHLAHLRIAAGEPAEDPIAWRRPAAVGLSSICVAARGVEHHAE